jgi:hypothetical protein
MTKMKQMTEPEWFASTDAYRMLQHIQQHVRISRTPGGARRLRLYGVACCRRLWPQYTDNRSRNAVEVAERYADGRARKRELDEARAAAEEVEQAAARELNRRQPAPEAVWLPFHRARILASSAQAGTRTVLVVRWLQILINDVLTLLLIGTGLTRESPEFQQEEKALADLVRDIFGNPFQTPPTVDDSWLAWNDRTVPRIARAVYDERAFDRLPVLADALEEAGCTNPEILDHCRNPAPHARGCWLIDLILTKE